MCTSQKIPKGCKALNTTYDKSCSVDACFEPSGFQTTVACLPMMHGSGWCSVDNVRAWRVAAGVTTDHDQYSIVIFPPGGPRNTGAMTSRWHARHSVVVGPR
ncbi:hypothetical protein BaRGS_00022013 [Batillaria attramentaria]|uniref:Uncharacterized protein n=1 Tax=Batillaria attramentaria TaxID=370345 RepID=A0ABD0KI60_9CAEN